MFRRIFAITIAALIVLGVLTVATPAQASSGSFVSRINGARRAAGRPSLSVRSDLSSVAYRHSQRMARGNNLHHNPNLAGQVSNWQAVGENVGRGGDVASLHQAFMNSPSHRANILDRDYTEVGVGVVVDGNGIMWVTEVFRRPYRTTTKAPTTKTPTRTKPRVTTRPAAPRTTTRPAAPSRTKVKAPKKPHKPVAAASRSAVLHARLVALAATPPVPVDGALPKAMSYLQVMAALGR